MANFRCKLCGKSFVSLESLYTHLEKYHSNEIPKDMSVPQYYYFLKTGKKNGNCVMCKHPTTWNKNTNKYNRFCDNPACKQKYADEFKKRMIGKYGKVHLLNDPQKQREMLAARSISGVYRWDDGTEMTYTGSYELDFIHLLADFFDWDPQDISAPSPHTYTYSYEGEDKFYIPDFFIHSLNLEIEVKDGGDNPNMHHKIQDVDKVKEKLKDEVLKSQKQFHYVKVTNKNYTNFFNFMMKMKEEFNKYGDENKIPRIFMCEDIRTKNVPDRAKIVYEAIELPMDVKDEVIEEEIYVDPEHMKLVLEFANELECAEIITESFVSELEKQVNNFLKLTVSDMEKSVKFTFNSKKGNHEDVEAYLKKLIKVSKSEKDMFLIKSMAQDYVKHCEKQSKTNPETVENERAYKQWMVSDYKKAYDKKWKKIHESFEYLSQPQDDDNEIVFEGSISIATINNLLAADDRKRLDAYIDAYETYYKRMEKERPEKIKNINQDIKQALKIIDDMAKSGKVSNDLAKYAKNRLDHQGIWVDPRKYNVMKEEYGIGNMSVVIGPTQQTRVFGLMDTKSKLFIDDEHYFSRPDGTDSVHCNLKKGSKEKECEGKRVLTYNIKPHDGSVSVNDIVKKYISEALTIPGLLKLTEASNGKFIKDVCSRMGIECDVELIEDKIY